MDEWITTHHNIYSTTALECLQELIKGGLAKDKKKDVLQNTQPASGDMVRLAAFKCLTETELTCGMPMTKCLLNNFTILFKHQRVFVAGGVFFFFG